MGAILRDLYPLSRREGRRRCRWVGAAALIGGTIFCSVASVRADVFRLAPWTGSVDTFVSFGRTDQSADSSDSTDQSMNAQQRLTLRNRGAYFFDQKLIRLDVGGTFALQQLWQKTDNVGQSSDEFDTGTLWGYDLGLSILPEAATSLYVFANRDQTSPPLLGAGSQEYTRENWGAKLTLDRLYIPSTLLFQRKMKRDEVNQGGVVSLTDETDDIIEYRGDRGWINSQLRIVYDFTDHTDHILPDQDFRSHQGRMDFALDFGPDLNWHWDSGMNFLNRTGTGALDLTTLNSSQLLRVEHSEQFTTTYGYTLGYSNSGGADTLRQSGRVRLRHKLYESLDTNFGVDGLYEDQTSGTRKRIGGNLNLGYRKRLSSQALLNAGLGGGYSYQVDNFSADEANAINELHTVTVPVANPVQLDNPFVITSTVVVTKVVNGPLPPGCSPFSVPRTLTEGQDYTLASAGTNLTEIVPIPCTLTTPGLNPGDTISVDYQYTVPGDSAFTTGTFTANISVNWPWIRVYARHFQQNQTLIKGDPGFLEDKRRELIGTQLSYNRERLRASARGEFEIYDATFQAFNALRLNQFLTYSILPEMTLNVTASQGLAKFSDPEGRTTRQAAVHPSLNYRISRGLSANAFFKFTVYDQSDQPLDLSEEAGVGMTWTYRKLTVAPTLKFLNRQRGDGNTKNYQFLLRITRWF